MQMRTGPRLCPDCRAPWEPANLDSRPVHSLSLAVRAYQQSRPYLLAATQQFDVQGLPSAAPAGDKSGTSLNPGSKRTRRQADRDSNPQVAQKQRMNASENQPPSGSMPAKISTCAGDEDDTAGAATRQRAQQDPPAGCGVCPICSRTVSLSYLQSHVDSCLISTEATSSKASVRHAAPGAVLDLTDSTGVRAVIQYCVLTNEPAQQDSLVSRSLKALLFATRSIRLNINHGG